jgi:hypothetical protein
VPALYRTVLRITYTHIHTYIHMYICICICICINTPLKKRTCRRNTLPYPTLPHHIHPTSTHHLICDRRRSRAEQSRAELIQAEQSRAERKARKARKEKKISSSACLTHMHTVHTYIHIYMQHFLSSPRAPPIRFSRNISIYQDRGGEMKKRCVSCVFCWL